MKPDVETTLRTNESSVHLSNTMNSLVSWRASETQSEVLKMLESPVHTHAHFTTSLPPQQHQLQ